MTKARRWFFVAIAWLAYILMPPRALVDGDVERLPAGTWVFSLVGDDGALSHYTRSRYVARWAWLTNCIRGREIERFAYWSGPDDDGDIRL